MRPYRNDATVSFSERPQLSDFQMVPKAGLEPARHKPRDFKSLASTDFATWAGQVSIAVRRAFVLAHAAACGDCVYAA